MSEKYANKSKTLNTSKSDDEELDILRNIALKTISSTKQPHPQQPQQPLPPRPTTHNMENNPYNNNYPDLRRVNNFYMHHHPHPQHLPRLPPHHMQPQPPQLHPTPTFYTPPQMQPRYHQVPPFAPGNQLWDRDYNSATSSSLFSPGASMVPTNVQLSPRSQAFVAENNDILLKRKGDRFLRRSRSKSWSRSPSPHGRSSSSYKNGRRFSPRKRSLSNSSGESPSGRKYSRRNNTRQQQQQQISPKSQEDQKKEQPKRRGGSPISFNDGKKEKEKEPQKITLNRNRIIQLNKSSRPAWNRNSSSNNNRNQQPSNSTPNVSRPREEEKEKEKEKEKVEEKPQTIESKSEPPPPETKKPPPVVKPPRVKTAEELLEDELLRSDDELDDGILLTNDDDLDILDDLFESESESENEGRFKSKTTNSKDSPISFSKLGEKSVAKIRPLDDVIDKSRNRGYDKGRIGNNISRKSGQSDKKSEKKPLEFRKLSLDRKKSYDKEPPRKVIIGRSSGNNVGGDLSKQPTSGLEKKSIYSRLGGKTSTSDGLDIKREKV
ncbi:hypothetical protein ACFFRR_003628 [Megaselia abdita]